MSWGTAVSLVWIGAWAGAWTVGLAPAVASASAPPLRQANDDVELRWDAPEDCPPRAVVLDELAAYRVGQVRRDVPVLVDVHVKRAPSAWSATVKMTVDGDRIERRFEAESCDVVASGVALLVAVAVDPGGMSEAVEPSEVAPNPEPNPEPDQEPDPEPNPQPHPESPSNADQPEQRPKPGLTAPARRRDLAAIVGVVAGGSWGDLPGVGPAVGLMAGMSIDRFRWSLEGRYAFAREALAVREPSPAGADLSAWSVGARGCYVATPRRLRLLQFPACAGANAGQIFGRGVGLETNRAVRSVYADAVLSGAIGVLPTPGLAITLGLEGFVSLGRPAFRIDDFGLVHRPAAGGARLWLGFEFHLGNNRWARRPKRG